MQGRTKFVRISPYQAAENITNPGRLFRFLCVMADTVGVRFYALYNSPAIASSKKAHLLDSEIDPGSPEKTRGCWLMTRADALHVNESNHNHARLLLINFFDALMKNVTVTFATDACCYLLWDRS